MPLSRLLFLAIFLLLCGMPVLVLLHATPQSRTLVVTGHHGELPVMEMNGHFYVNIEALARLTNGSLNFRGNQIVLTLPASGTSTPATNSEASRPGDPGFSKEFVKAAIEEMAVIREWRSALLNAIRQGYPVTEDWVGTFRAQAQQNLRFVSLAVSTEADRNALQLLTNESNNMKKLTDRFLEASRSRTYVPPNALENDPLDQRILNCAHSLAAMASSNQFVDDGSCH